MWEHKLYCPLYDMYLACLKVAQHTSNKSKVNFLRFHDPKYGSSVYVGGHS